MTSTHLVTVFNADFVYQGYVGGRQIKWLSKVCMSPLATYSLNPNLTCVQIWVSKEPNQSHYRQ